MRPIMWCVREPFHMTPQRWRVWNLMFRGNPETFKKTFEDYPFLRSIRLPELDRWPYNYVRAMLITVCQWRDLVLRLKDENVLERGITWKMFNCPPPGTVFVPESHREALWPCKRRICPFCMARAALRFADRISPGAEGKRLILSTGVRYRRTPSRADLKELRRGISRVFSERLSVPAVLQFSVRAEKEWWRVSARAISDICACPHEEELASERVKIEGDADFTIRRQYRRVKYPEKIFSPSLRLTPPDVSIKRVLNLMSQMKQLRTCDMFQPIWHRTGAS